MTALRKPHQLLELRGKTVIVTGAGAGLGMGVARRFAEAGASVAIHYRSHAQQAEQLAESLANEGATAMIVQGDVSSAQDVSRIFATVVETWGKVDILINNAGIYPRATLLEMTEAQWDEVVDVNLKSVFLCTQAAARDMVSRGEGGAIVNIASIEAVNPAAEHSHYAAAKAGVVMFTQTPALELGSYQIRVNAVSPGLINSPALPGNWPEGVARWMNRVPLGRLGEPDDVGDVCVFLASDAARFMTGVNILIDGGVMTSQIY